MTRPFFRTSVLLLATVVPNLANAQRPSSTLIPKVVFEDPGTPAPLPPPPDPGFALHF